MKLNLIWVSKGVGLEGWDPEGGGGGWGGNTVYAYFLELHEHNLKQMSHFQTFYSQHEFLDALFDTSLPYQSQKMNEILYFT